MCSAGPSIKKFKRNRPLWNSSSKAVLLEGVVLCISITWVSYLKCSSDCPFCIWISNSRALTYLTDSLGNPFVPEIKGMYWRDLEQFWGRGPELQFATPVDLDDLGSVTLPCFFVSNFLKWRWNSWLK